jgi:hypothetical protein
MTSAAKKWKPSSQESQTNDIPDRALQKLQCPVGFIGTIRRMIKINHLLPNLILLTVLAACQSAPTPAQPNFALTTAYETAVAQISKPTETPTTLATSLPTPTIPRTPPALPAIYQTTFVKPGDLPRTYIGDTCQYLQNKWNPANSTPGTIVMVIMFHGIIKDAVSNYPKNITVNDFKKLMNNLYGLGFQAINMQQMSDFMYDNAKIPQRSVLLTVDDRHQAANFNDHFRPYYEQWGWPVINGWISAFGGDDQFLLENVALSNEGWVDYQAHGYIHNIPITDSSTDGFINAELQGSITNFQTYFKKTPIAYIWPGGGFTPRAVEIATQLGYKLGFTVNPRGPVMYNWVPQADSIEASNAVAIPETSAKNPLMTLPRFWDANANGELDNVRQVGEQAAQYAEQNKATELAYYDIMCAPTHGPIPGLQ